MKSRYELCEINLWGCKSFPDMLRKIFYRVTAVNLLWVMTFQDIKRLKDFPFLK